MAVPGATDVKYLPRALERVSKVVSVIESRPTVFLDFDGTLAPIVNDPARARMPQSTRSAVRALVERCPVAIVSGRSAIDVRDLVGLPGVVYSGSHGQEINFPDGTRFEYPESVEHLGALDKAERVLGEELAGLGGIWVERKPFAIAVHTRMAESIEAVEKAGQVAEKVAHAQSLLYHTGKEVFEMRPNVAWNKGKAITYLLGFFNGGVPVFIGDDETDEDGFAAVRRHNGVSIVVEKSNDRLSAADYRLNDTYEVTSFLTRLSQAL